MSESPLPVATTEPVQTAAIVPTEGDNFELSASTPIEMVQCHHAAIEWCQRKIAVMQGEADELRAAYEHARAKKWKSDTLKRHADLADKRITFYQKMLAAFKAGYYIVPNFPVTLFAIKTDAPKPRRMWLRLKSERHANFEQEAKLLPVGEGGYQNPQPLVQQDWGTGMKDEHGSETYGFYASAWSEMEFPANMARIHVMEAATKAMDAKIFDEIGFLPQDYKRNPDPLLIGRIIDPRSSTYNKRVVSFMLAWHINTATL